MAATVKDSHQTLVALTSSALLLPAYQGARADAPPEFTELGLRYSKYQEDDTAGGKTFGGSSERMEVDVAQFHLLAPVADDWAFALDVSWEDMSGASPWFVGQENPQAPPRTIMSSASIEDTRTEVSVTTRYYYDRGNAGLNYTHSDEDDYESHAVTLDGSLNSEDGMRTYSAAVSGSDDTIEPTQGEYPTHTLKDEKDIRSAWVGVTQIVSKRALLRFGLSYTYRDGFLTDPYKSKDQRPDTRREWVASAGYRHFFTDANGAAHVDYRYFDDDWGVSSHTVDFAWHQNLDAQTALIPFLRYYTQGEADFFANIVDERDRYFADDYRLSAYGAISLGLRLRHNVGNWSFSLSGERYKTDNSWGVFGGDESPALVNFWRGSIGLDYVFK